MGRVISNLYLSCGWIAKPVESENRYDQETLSTQENGLCSYALVAIKNYDDTAQPCWIAAEKGLHTQYNEQHITWQKYDPKRKYRPKDRSDTGHYEPGYSSNIYRKDVKSA